MSCKYRRGNIYWYKAYVNGHKVEFSLKTTDRTEANYLKAKKDQELAENQTPISRDAMCRTALDEYLSFMQHRSVPAYISDTKSRIERFLTTTNVRYLKDITEKLVEKYVRDFLNTERTVRAGTKKEKKVKPSLHSGNNTISAIKIWLNWCVKNKYLFHNPIMYMKKFEPPENFKRSFSKEEIARIMDRAKAEPIYAAVATAVYTGMRKAEIFSLEWDDIDFDHNTIVIKNKDGFSTKSGKNRIISLNPRLKAVLEPMRRPGGHCFSRTNERRYIYKIMRDAGIKDGGWHLFRHTAATTMLRNGADLMSVSKFLGHHDITVTQGYLHTAQQNIRAAGDKLDF